MPMPMPMPEPTAPPAVRRLRTDEHAAVRDLRLRALADAPDAFWERLADARTRTLDQWEEQTRAWATDDEHAVFVIDPGPMQGGGLLGMVGVEPTSDGDVGIWGLWLDSAARGTGAGAGLLAAVDAWARSGSYDHGGEQVKLWANAANAALLDWYRRRGFTRTGREWRDERRPDEVRRFVELARPVDR